MNDRLMAAGSLEDELRALGGWVVLPPTPAIAEAVGQALAGRRGRASAPVGFRWLSVVLAVVALLALAAAAVAIAWVMGGVRLTFTDATPSVLPASASIRGVPGSRAVSLAEARGLVGFPIQVPRLAALAAPDRVLVDTQRPTGGSVTLAYAARPGYPAGRDGSGLLITEFRADISPEVFDKLITTGVRVERTTVNALPAFWVAGGNHFFFYRDANGRLDQETIRLVGDTLIWESSGLTLRVEGAPSLDAARAVAGSLAASPAE